MYKYYIFDLDGTLLNTISDLRNAINITFRRLGFPEVDDKKVKETIDFLLSREEAHNALFREAFNKVQKTGSDRDFGTTKAARMYFSMSEPSPEQTIPADASFKAPHFN